MIRTDLFRVPSLSQEELLKRLDMLVNQLNAEIAALKKKVEELENAS